jgi:hypothetical protein
MRIYVLSWWLDGLMLGGRRRFQPQEAVFLGVDIRRFSRLTGQDQAQARMQLIGSMEELVPSLRVPGLRRGSDIWLDRGDGGIAVMRKPGLNLRNVIDQLVPEITDRTNRGPLRLPLRFMMHRGEFAPSGPDASARRPVERVGQYIERLVNVLDPGEASCDYNGSLIEAHELLYSRQLSYCHRVAGTLAVIGVSSAIVSDKHSSEFGSFDYAYDVPLGRRGERLSFYARAVPVGLEDAARPGCG